MIVKNIAYLYAIQALRLFLPLALLSVISKALSASQYSVYIYTLACAAWLGCFIEYGFNFTATRGIASFVDPAAIRSVILQTQAARWLLTGVSFLFVAWAVLISSVFSGHREWAVASWAIGVMIGMTPTYYYQAISKLRSVAVLEMGGGVVTFVAILLLINGEEDFWRLCWVLILARLVICYTLNRQMFADHNLRLRDTFNISQGLLALKDGWKVFLVQLAASFYTSFNVVLLGGVSNAYAVAVYGSCERLVRAGLSFIAQTTSAVFPRLNEIKSRDPARLASARRLSLLALIAGSIACMPLVWWLAPLISDVLFHNTLPDIPTVLSIMALVIPAIAISNVLAYHFLVVDRQEHVLNWVTFAAVPIFLTIGYLFAHKYGAAGMAIAWVVVEWLVAGALALIIFYTNRRF